MRPEYAPNGLVGLLTPQANTTVEPEFSVLMPNGVTWLNARLKSGKPSIRERLIDYMDELPQSCRQFGNAPIEALALGCTGTAYFVGAAREDAILSGIAEELKIPVFSAATAVDHALQTLQAKNIVLVSPYDGDVDEACGPYWIERGLSIKAKVQATGESGFHPIYSMNSSDGDQAMASLDTSGVDAIVILGTGMPTLATLVRLHQRFACPVLSCMLCLGWRTACALDPTQGDAAHLRQWATGSHWSAQLSRFSKIK
ncbi:MAG: hypothetical protein WA888_11565 [Burkholderiaceae bacterium]